MTPEWLHLFSASKRSLSPVTILIYNAWSWEFGMEIRQFAKEAESMILG